MTKTNTKGNIEGCPVTDKSDKNDTYGLSRSTLKTTHDTTSYPTYRKLLKNVGWLSNPKTRGRLYPSNWDKIRRWVLTRDNFRCKVCGLRLEVHHLIPVAKGGSHSPNNLVTVCSKCHKRIHQIRKPLVKTLSFKPKTVLRKLVPIRLSPAEEKPKPKPISPLEKRLFQQFITEIKLPEPTKTIFLASLKPEHLDLLFTGWLLDRWEKGGGSISKLLVEILRS